MSVESSLGSALTAKQQESIAQKFYAAFQQLDAETMATYYHPEASFQDPGFTLEGREVPDMWRMLCSRAKDFELRFEILSSTQDTVKVSWEADYTFSKTGRRVNNRIVAELTFKDGLIYQHHDSFDFWRWSRQALGLPGLLLGWSTRFQALVSKQAMAQLLSYQKKQLAKTS